MYMTVSREPAPLRMGRVIVGIQAMASMHMCGGSHTTYRLSALQGNSADTQKALQLQYP